MILKRKIFFNKIYATGRELTRSTKLRPRKNGETVQLLDWKDKGKPTAKQLHTFQTSKAAIV